MLHDYVHELNEINKLIGSQNLYKVFAKAFDNFQKDNFKFFDPHVGDTSCQIRACIVIYMKNSIHIRKKLEETTAQEFLQNPTWVQYSYFLLTSYILTIFCLRDKYGGSTKMDICGISDFFHISNSKSKTLVKIIQQGLSRFSCEFIYQLSNELTVDYSNQLSKFMLKGDDDRSLLPCYMASDIIYRYLKKHHIPISITVHYGDGEIKHHRLATHSNLKIAFNLICYCNHHSTFHEELQDQFNKKFDEIYYENQSNHPQYCGLKLKKFKQSPFSIPSVRKQILSSPNLLKLKQTFEQHLNLKTRPKCIIMHMNLKNIVKKFESKTDIETFSLAYSKNII